MSRTNDAPHSRNPDDDWDRRRRQHNEIYTKEYAAWWQSLTPAEQAKARADGDDYGLMRSGTWDAAERAALRACCAGWASIPGGAYLTNEG